MTRSDEGALTRHPARRIRLLPFGLPGGALTHALVLLYPTLLPANVSLPAAVYLGGLTGVLVLGTLARLFGPPARSAAYYTTLIELKVQKCVGWMDEENIGGSRPSWTKKIFWGRAAAGVCKAARRPSRAPEVTAPGRRQKAHRRRRTASAFNF